MSILITLNIRWTNEQNDPIKQNFLHHLRFPVTFHFFFWPIVSLVNHVFCIPTLYISHYEVKGENNTLRKEGNFEFNGSTQESIHCLFVGLLQTIIKVCFSSMGGVTTDTHTIAHCTSTLDGILHNGCGEMLRTAFGCIVKTRNAIIT